MADALCVKLDRHDIGAYEHEESAQSGQALTADQAAISLRLANGLAGG